MHPLDPRLRDKRSIGRAVSGEGAWAAFLQLRSDPARSLVLWGPRSMTLRGEPLATRARADAQRAASLGPAYRIVKLPLRPYDDCHEYFDGDGP